MAKDVESQYAEALDWIHSSMRFGSRLGLERITRLLEILGNPQKNAKFIHIAGTNGKGSVTAMVASILSTSGYRTGMYISPYLEDYRERMMINGKKIPKEKLVELVSQVRPAVEQILKEGFDHPTEFEINTALAFLYFAQEECDYVALEVGLGGRLDATNVVTPAVSVITTIGYDHMTQLGNTLSEIAFEKAGIIKPKVPVVTGVVEEEPLEVIRKRAAQSDSDLVIVGQAPFANVTWEEVHPETIGSDDLSPLRGPTIDIIGPDYRYDHIYVPLLGKHQELNAALAVAALEAARVKPLRFTVQNSEEESATLPIALDHQGIEVGMARTEWPGRLEVMHKNPLIILDAAHNPQGAQVLADFLKELEGRRIICVYGILGDKCYKESTAFICPLCQEVIVTKPHTPRALDPFILAQEVEKYVEKVTVEENLDKAMELAISKASSNDVVICCGSLYLVGPARTFVRKKFGIPEYGGE